MTDTISLTGIVATDPKHIMTGEGLAITHFRLASTQRRYDKANERWVDADTNWYTITAFRQLAINASSSLRKGERAVVSGRVRIREWDNGERKGTTVDVEADAIGHDLAWGCTTFTRSIAALSSPPPDGVVREGFDADVASTPAASAESTDETLSEGSLPLVSALAEPESVPF
jgi:single-strand DNA-binding protein